VLAHYLQLAEAGQAPDRCAFIDSHPDFADELRAFFSNYDRLDRLPAELGKPLASPGQESMAESLQTIDMNQGAQPTVEGTAPALPRRFGDYELLAEIARGGMGVVYRAREMSVDRLVALKMIRDQDLASDEEVQRFYLEAEAAAGLEHPHIVRIHKIGTEAGQHYFTMQLVEGGSLARRLAAARQDGGAGLLPREAARLLIAVARAVHFAHQHGILHRDLKPANILLQNDELGTLNDERKAPNTSESEFRVPRSAFLVPKITDFGLAKQIDQTTALTQQGAILGTPSYMAPEQARAEASLTTAVDVYALGAILYELLTGRPPFQGATPLDTLFLVLEKEPPRPRALQRTIDRDLETICLKCLQKDPRRRYVSAEAFAVDLERWLAHRPIRARRNGPLTVASKWVRRHPAITALLLLLLVAPFGVHGYSRWEQSAAEHKRRAEEEAHRHKVAQYQGNIEQVEAALRAGDPERARELLRAAAVPEVRGWEWELLDALCDRTPARVDLRPAVPFEALPRQVELSRDGQRAVALYQDVNKTWHATSWDLTTGELSEDVVPTGRQAWGAQANVCLSGDGRLVAVTVPNDYRVVRVPQYDDRVGLVYRDLFGRTTYVPRRSYLPSYYGRPSYGLGGLRDPYGLGGLGRGYGGLSSHGMFGGYRHDPLGQLGLYGMDPYFGRMGGLGFNPDPHGRLILNGSRGWGPGYSDPLARVLSLGSYPGGLGGFYYEDPLQDLLSPYSMGYGRSLNLLPLEPAMQQRQTILGILGIFDVVARRQPTVVNSGMDRAVFSGDGTLVAVSVGAGVSVRRVATGEVAHTLGSHSSAVHALAFSPDAKTLATGGADGTVFLWDLATGQVARKFESTAEAGSGAEQPTGPGTIERLLFSPDGKRLLAATRGGSTRCHDLASGQDAFTLEGVSRALAFTPDGTRLVVACDEGGLRIVRSDSGEKVCAFPGLNDKVQSVAFRPDGTLVVLTASTSGLAVTTWKIGS
jgi:serine/threonine protein kinase/WD40 repeat protein